MKKISLVSSTRADFGLLRNLINKLRKSPFFKLRLLVTGSHLSAKHGNTYREIIDEKIQIDSKIKIKIFEDSNEGISLSIADTIKKFTQEFNDNKPDILILLGDRYEIFAVASAAYTLGIPIAHIHGGEVTAGSLDEGFRHSISKFSSLHFAATNEYRRRIIQLGENPKNVFNVGGLSLDNIMKKNLVNKELLESKLNFKFGKKSILLTYHPYNIDRKILVKDIKEIFKALSFFNDLKVIVTMPNSDANGIYLADLISKIVIKNKNIKIYKSLGWKNYLSCLHYVDMVIGNSSSAILEAPSYGIPSINIGDRQKGRVFSQSVISVNPDHKKIIKAIKKGYSKNFQEKLLKITNPYGMPGASSKIISILKKFQVSNNAKIFYDI